MKQQLLALVCLITLASGVFYSCDEGEDISQVNQQTVVIFMPWSGNLYEFFKENIDSIKSAIVANKGTGKSRVMLFLSKNTQTSTLSELVYNTKTGKCDVVDIREYTGNSYTSADGITDILNEVKSYADALNYAMIIGCHGTGWTPKSAWKNYPFEAKRHGALPRYETSCDEEPPLQTRFYGAIGNASFQTDISELAQGIANAGIKMQYILFDDCYMANVETAYELRNVTNFLLASTSEVMAFGMPYHTMWKSLCTPTPNYANAVNAFVNFYKTYSDYGRKANYGTLSAIDCRVMDKVAAIMREINQSSTWDDEKSNSLETLDGFAPTLFYDFGSYLTNYCSDAMTLNKMNDELSELVKATQKTDTIFTSIKLKGTYYIVPQTFSGITISDPSIHPVATQSVTETAWYRDTHRAN